MWRRDEKGILEKAFKKIDLTLVKWILSIHLHLFWWRLAIVRNKSEHLSTLKLKSNWAADFNEHCSVIYIGQLLNQRRLRFFLFLQFFGTWYSFRCFFVPTNKINFANQWILFFLSFCLFKLNMHTKNKMSDKGKKNRKKSNKAKIDDDYHLM